MRELKNCILGGIVLMAIVTALLLIYGQNATATGHVTAKQTQTQSKASSVPSINLRVTP